jgi:hypothetical protein
VCVPWRRPLLAHVCRWERPLPGTMPAEFDLKAVVCQRSRQVGECRPPLGELGLAFAELSAPCPVVVRQFPHRRRRPGD